MSQNLSEAELQEIAMTTHGYVGADLISLCSQANLLSSRRLVREIEFSDLKAALKKVRPSAMREVQIEVIDNRPFLLEKFNALTLFADAEC